MTAKEKVRAAGKATDKVQDLVREVRDVLQVDFVCASISAYGVYMHYYDKVLALSEAVEKLQQARTIMAATAWPADADYDAAERETSAEE